MSTGKQQRPVKMFNKKPGEENSPKPADENKQVTVPLKDFQSLQKTVKDLSKKLSRYEPIYSEIQAIKKTLEDPDMGISKTVNYIGEQAESNYDEIHIVRAENAQLRRELDLMRAMLIKFDRKMENVQSEVTDLRARSMRDNILIHNFPYKQGENLMQIIPETIKDTLGVDIQFVRIHRNSVKGVVNSKPVSITGKLVDRKMKDELLQAQKSKKMAKVTLPFFITTQEPTVMVEEKKRLYAISDMLRSQNIRTKVEWGRIVLPNGEKYQEPIPKLESSDVLQIATQDVELVDSVSTDPTQKKGSEIFASGARVSSSSDVQNLYQKVNLDPFSASADHRILVYRFTDSSSRIQEGYYDDGEHGAGRRLLHYIKTNQMQNIAVVITRRSGHTRLGPERFHIMEEHVCDVANLLDNL